MVSRRILRSKYQFALTHTAFPSARPSASPSITPTATPTTTTPTAVPTSTSPSATPMAVPTPTPASKPTSASVRCSKGHVLSDTDTGGWIPTIVNGPQNFRMHYTRPRPGKPNQKIEQTIGSVLSVMPIADENNLRSCSRTSGNRGCLSFLLLLDLLGAPPELCGSTEHFMCRDLHRINTTIRVLSTPRQEITQAGSSSIRRCTWHSSRLTLSSTRIALARLVCPVDAHEDHRLSVELDTASPGSGSDIGNPIYFTARATVEALCALDLGVRLSACIIPFWGKINQDDVLEWSLYHKAMGVERIHVTDQRNRGYFDSQKDQKDRTTNNNTSCDRSLGGWAMPDLPMLMGDILERNHSTNFPKFRDDRLKERKGVVQPYMWAANIRLDFCVHEHYRDQAMILELSLDEWLVCAKSSQHRSSTQWLPVPPVESFYPQMSLQRYLFIRDKSSNNSSSNFRMAKSLRNLGRRGSPKYVVAPRRVTQAGIHGNLFETYVQFPKARAEDGRCGQRPICKTQQQCEWVVYPPWYTDLNRKRCGWRRSNVSKAAVGRQFSPHESLPVCGIHHIIDMDGNSDAHKSIKLFGLKPLPLDLMRFAFESPLPRVSWVAKLQPDLHALKRCNITDNT